MKRYFALAFPVMLTIAIISLCNTSICSSSTCLTYHRDIACSNAKQFWGGIEGHKGNFSGYNWVGRKDIKGLYGANSSDCANFVSQCLVEGSLTNKFNANMCNHEGVPDNSPWYSEREGCVDIYGMIVRANALPAILKIYFGCEVSESMTRDQMPPKLAIGDVIVMGTADKPRRHASIVVETDGTFANTKVATHTVDHYNKELTYFVEKKLTRFTYIESSPFLVEI